MTIMKKQLTIKEKQEVLLELLKNNPEKKAYFGIEKEVALPLVKAGILHRDTYRYTGGCILNSKNSK